MAVSVRVSELTRLLSQLLTKPVAESYPDPGVEHLLTSPIAESY